MKVLVNLPAEANTNACRGCCCHLIFRSWCAAFDKPLTFDDHGIMQRLPECLAGEATASALEAVAEAAGGWVAISSVKLSIEDAMYWPSALGASGNKLRAALAALAKARGE